MRAREEKSGVVFQQARSTRLQVTNHGIRKIAQRH